MTNTELFGEVTIEPSKYASWDVEALRKKAEAADDHIKILEVEAANRRDSEKTNATLEDVLKKLDMVNQTPAPYTLPVVNPTPVTSSPQGEQITKSDVLNILDQKQKELQAKANVERIKSELRKVWGDNFSTKLTEKSTEIGVNQDFLASMAEQYPDAFLKLVLETKSTSNPNVHVAPSTMGTPTGSLQFVGETRKDFKAAEKANPALIHDAGFQRRKHEAAARLGDAFFK